MTIKEKILGQIKKNKKVNQKLLAEIGKKARNYSELKSLLIENNLLDEEELLLIFSKEFKLPFLDLKKYKISHRNQELLPKEIAFKYNIVPVCKIGNVLTLAASQPPDIITQDDIRIIAGAEKIDFVLCRQEDIKKTLNTLYKTAEEIAKAFEEEGSFDIEEIGEKKETEEGKQDLESLITESKHPPIVRAINLIVYNALKKRSSDIHVEPYEDKVLVKYRIDGVLNEEFSFPKKNQLAVAARLKIISSLDITEARLPQDGRFKVKFENREIDFRVSSLPTNFGEKFVLRVLDKRSLSVGLDKLGFSPGPLELFEEAIKAPFGIILVTGPTGSGKSTTLAALIDQINQKKQGHIITVEDPIEFLHTHKKCIINQREVYADTNSFPAALRVVLREDPDVVLIGEMRDLETIEAALRIAETGHLTFATLHTNSAYTTINRVVDAFPPHQQQQIRAQLSLVLEGIVCQALLPKSDGTGRVAACEILIPTAGIRNLIRENKVHQIYSMMQAGQDKYGMMTLNQSLAQLYLERKISHETCLAESSNPDELKQILARSGDPAAGRFAGD